MKVGRRLLRQIERHARRSLHEEVCGIVYGQEYFPLKNRSLSPESAFEADPVMLAKLLWRRGEPDAVFHTHPGGQSRASEIDKQLAYYINSTMLIGTWSAGRLSLRVIRPGNPAA